MHWSETDADMTEAMATTSEADREVHQQTQSPLFKLPAELRNSIYELACLKKSFVLIDYHGCRRHALQPALSRACRALRIETLPIWYSNKFLMIIFRCLLREGCDTFCQYKWLRAIAPQQRKMLQHVYFKSFAINEMEERRPDSPEWARKFGLLCEDATCVGRWMHWIVEIEVDRLDFEKV